MGRIRSSAASDRFNEENVKQDPANGKPRSRATLLKAGLAYAAAVVLPYLGAILGVHMRQFQGTPMALCFASIAGVTILGGFGPGLVASLVTGIAFRNIISPVIPVFSHGPRELAHMAAIVLLGLVVTFLCQRQKIVGDRLRIALAKVQNQADALVEAQQASGSVAWTYNTRNQRIEWAEGGAPIFGYPFDDASMSDLPIHLVVEEDREAVSQAFQSAFESRIGFHVQFRGRWRDGEIRWFESRGNPSAFDKTIWRGVTLDITERKQAELALLRAEKLAAIGRLSATIAHEINNPLEAVTNLLYLSSTDPALTGETRAYLATADEELRRLASIARHTLTFARTRPSVGPVEAAPVVESVAAMFRPRCASRDAEIRTLGARDLRLALPSDDLRQILTNLVSNACDALREEGGVIEVEIRRSKTQAGVICVRDNGVGIQPENVAHIFDPFFTTKNDVGTGIGLWVTRELVERNGGEISVQTANLPPGFHTMFCVELPLAESESRTSYDPVR
ncbi:MAG TPA: ATP-binding protein [Candidatus Aquilonibacter sp.]|nr:ATP-binding protein [Candidatus Aquilonibacter sp.]